jgi:hypothetical protein
MPMDEEISRSATLFSLIQKVEAARNYTRPRDELQLNHQGAHIRPQRCPVMITCQTEMRAVHGVAQHIIGVEP